MEFNLMFKGLNKIERISLTQRAIAAKAKSLLDEIQQKEGGNETVTASKGWFASFKQSFANSLHKS